MLGYEKKGGGERWRKPLRVQIYPEDGFLPPCFPNYLHIQRTSNCLDLSRCCRAYRISIQIPTLRMLSL